MRYVEKLEDENWVKDNLMEDRIERFVINFGEESNSDLTLSASENEDELLSDYDGSGTDSNDVAGYTMHALSSNS